MNRLMSICHPSMFYNSVGVPSTFSLRMLVASSRGIGSFLFTGRNIACTARGAAF